MLNFFLAECNKLLRIYPCLVFPRVGLFKHKIAIIVCVYLLRSTMSALYVASVVSDRRNFVTCQTDVQSYRREMRSLTESFKTHRINSVYLQQHINMLYRYISCNLRVNRKFNDDYMLCYDVCNSKLFQLMVLAVVFSSASEERHEFNGENLRKYINKIYLYVEKLCQFCWSKFGVI